MKTPTICLENEHFTVRPFGSDDLQNYDKLVWDIYQVLSDEETLHFIPEKCLKSVADARNWLNGTILNLHNGRNKVHFIISNESGKILGIIDLIPPLVVKEHYYLRDYPHFIEFYLSGKLRGRSIMTSLLPVVIKELNEIGIDKIAAVVNRENHAARKVLKRSGFVLQTNFDNLQDLYALSA
jgi:ribosomal-protein-alanine N-acetyltransferase